MKIVRHRTAQDLLDRAESWLLGSEAENNLVLGVATRFAADVEAAQGPFFWATVENEGTVVGCAFRTPPHQLSLTAMPAEAIGPLAEAVHDADMRLPGVAGPTRLATQFAEAWTTLTDHRWDVLLGMKIHKLTDVEFPKLPPDGKLRRPALAEIDLITDWVTRFARETGMTWRPRELVNRLQNAGKLYLWDDGGPRCMVAVARESPRGACINAVYTPAVNRRHGYASVAVAALCRRLLSEGKGFCCLYTDTSNRISNSIYRKIGFAPIRDDVHIEFSCPTDDTG